jgi:hypothetical protein
MGMVVASHTYPDPGCVLPEPKPEPGPESEPGSGDPNAVSVPDTDVQGWVFVNCKYTSDHPIDGASTSRFLRRIKSIEERLLTWDELLWT